MSSALLECFSLSQAQARCHRIGQNKAVKVYRLITRNSYEREMFDRASLKLGLDKAVLQSMSGRDNSLGGSTGGGVSLTLMPMTRMPKNLLVFVPSINTTCFCILASIRR